MKHLLKKMKLRGAGSKKPSVTPATLRPPTVGDFQFSSSFSFAENLDLISDGPIEGLVNSNGSLLSPKTVSQGIYLNGTSISVTNDDLISNDIFLNEDSFQGVSINVSDIQSNLSSFSQKNDTNLLVNYRIKSYRGTILTFFNFAEDYNFYHIKGREYDLTSTNTTPSIPVTSIDEYNVAGILIEDKTSTDYFITVGDSAKLVQGYYRTILQTNPYQRFQEIKTAYDNAITEQNVYMETLINNKMVSVFGQEWKNQTAEELHNNFFTQSDRLTFVYDLTSKLISNPTSVIDQNDEVINVILQPTDGNSNVRVRGEIKNLLIPKVNSDGDLTGEILGLYTVSHEMDIDLTSKTEYSEVLIKRILLDSLIKVSNFNVKETINTNAVDGGQYNYSNVLIENRFGEERQFPFKYFNKVFIDKNIQQELYGPYRLSGEIQRISQPNQKSQLKQSDVDYFFNNSDSDLDGFPDSEGSNDSSRGAGDDSYTKWNENDAKNIGDELASPITHIVYNPNVSEAFVTLAINSLFDTVDKDKGNDENSLRAGDKIPAILNIEIEIGKINSDGSETEIQKYRYRISAVVENVTLIDIGNPSSLNLDESFTYIKNLTEIDRSLGVPFQLPKVQYKNNIKSDEIQEKRFIRVKKLSTETFSILIRKDVSLAKITEIIDSNFSYPFSAIIGTKIDSRQFNSLPERTFDARLKKIKIPKNYYPTDEFNNYKDKRYYNKVADFNNTERDDKHIYQGDWDGTFKIGWTDNPAWILYDLLTNSRYGLGQQISETEVNKWELYKIARFCDAVDNDGYFVGVPDSQGGLEPRFSCNIMFNNNEKIFDAIQTISELFRGKTFFRSSEISFVDERIKEPIAIFNNINVKDGIFNYANLRRDQQYNTVEIGYLDRFENFNPKIEVVEDAEDIRERGVFKTKIDALGVTSKAMARRIGQHLIYKTIKENQKVAFSTGFEALLCQPGDLIVVEDDLKSNKSNFGKILAVDEANEYIRLSGPYDASTMDAVLTVYIPTGDQTNNELSTTASKLRERSYENFFITGNAGITSFNYYTGEWGFSGYTSGYSREDTEEYNVFEEYALYTGDAANKFLYFFTSNNQASGAWRFSSNEPSLYPNSDLGNYDYSLNSGINSLSIANISGSLYNTIGTLQTSLENSGIFSGLNMTNGILDEEIVLGSNSQITTLLITGSLGDVSGYRGSYVSGVDNPQYLSFIKPGSPYRLQITDSSDFIYKIESIQEQNINEYLVSASKFETGKYGLIENDISIEPKENTYAYEVSSQVGDVAYINLDAPENLSLTTGIGSEIDTFFVTAQWNEVTNNNGYNVILNLPNRSSLQESVDQYTTQVTFDNIDTVGIFNLNVKAIGDLSTNNKYFDSNYSSVSEFFIYEDITEFEKPFISSIKFF